MPKLCDGSGTLHVTISIRETFEVGAPALTVWRFITDPHKAVLCMPGAELEQVVDERTFLGNVKVKVGPMTPTYKGQVQITELDEHSLSMLMIAEGREVGGSGGMARATMSGRLETLADGQTNVAMEADIDLTGRVAQFGRGMIQDISHQLFQQFASTVKERLEAGEGATLEGEAAGEREPLRILPMFFRALWAAIARTLRRLFRFVARRGD